MKDIGHGSETTENDMTATCRTTHAGGPGGQAGTGGGPHANPAADRELGTPSARTAWRTTGRGRRSRASFWPALGSGCPPAWFHGRQTTPGGCSCWDKQPTVGWSTGCSRVRQPFNPGCRKSTFAVISTLQVVTTAASPLVPQWGIDGGAHRAALVSPREPTPGRGQIRRGDVKSGSSVPLDRRASELQEFQSGEWLLSAIITTKK